MNPGTKRISRLAAAAGPAAIAALLLLSTGCRRPEPGTYATPDEAVQALHDLIGSGDDRRTEEMFGPGSLDVFRSGDEVDDREAADRVKQLIAEKVAFEEFDDQTRVALFGEKAWPFPIPLVRSGERWHFDTPAGREELLNRRIGFNELATLASLHAYVDAQAEYAAFGPDGAVQGFARKFISSEGQHDGLFWPTAEGESLSPLGDEFAAAARDESAAGEPFRGYRYRILEGQGQHAPGGEKSYLDERGRMTRGFAAIAWPAKHGNSGLMTFVINQRDIVFQKDLGPETEQAAAAILSFDPDPTWEPTSDSLPEDDEAEDSAAEEQTSADSTNPGS